MIAFNGPLKPGDVVTLEWEGKKFEAKIEEIAFRAGEPVSFAPGVYKTEPIKLTLSLVRMV